MVSGVEGAFERLARRGRRLPRRRSAPTRSRQGIGYAEQRLCSSAAWRRRRPRRCIEDMLDAYAAGDDAAHRAAGAVGCPAPTRGPCGSITQTAGARARTARRPHRRRLLLHRGGPPAQGQGRLLRRRARLQRRATRAARSAILYHVGESFRDKSLESAVRWVQEAAELGAHRLGHAIALGVDPRRYGEHTRTESGAERLDQIAYDLAHADGLARARRRASTATRSHDEQRSRCSRRRRAVTHQLRRGAARRGARGARTTPWIGCIAAGAVVEVCPTSNRRIGDIADPAHHPVHRFLDRGVPVVVSSDDPGIFGVTLADEIDWVVEPAGLDDDARRELVENGWRYRSEVMTGRTASEHATESTPVSRRSATACSRSRRRCSSSTYASRAIAAERAASASAVVRRLRGELHHHRDHVGEPSHGDGPDRPVRPAVPDDHVFLLMFIAFVPFPTRLIAETPPRRQLSPRRSAYGITLTRRRSSTTCSGSTRRAAGACYATTPTRPSSRGISRSYRPGPWIYLAATLVGDRQPGRRASSCSRRSPSST